MLQNFGTALSRKLMNDDFGGFTSSVEPRGEVDMYAPNRQVSPAPSPCTTAAAGTCDNVYLKSLCKS
jgi:hypothetical protein